MPMKTELYPENWKEIALRIKQEADWACEKCGMQCRRPGEKFDTHKRTLTVAHISHVEADCRDENLVALCSGCHLRYDATRRSMQRLAKKRIVRATKSALESACSSEGDS